MSITGVCVIVGVGGLSVMAGRVSVGGIVARIAVGLNGIIVGSFSGGAAQADNRIIPKAKP